MQRVVGDDQVAGRRDWQELRDALHESEHEGVAHTQLGGGPAGRRGHGAQRRVRRSEDHEGTQGDERQQETAHGM